MDIFLVVIITAAIQSLFGVGVLLFGTPILLILDYTFFEALMILLPISMAINTFQITKDYKYININIYRNILYLTIPTIVIFLYFISVVKINLHLIMGLFLLFIAAKDKFDILKNTLENILSYNKTFYIIMGAIHGMTNLGGALLTAKIFHTNLNKYEKRATIAAAYLTFAIFQIATLIILSSQFELINLFYVLLGILIYFGINKITFHNLSNDKYNQLFSIFLLFSALVLIYKGISW